MDPSITDWLMVGITFVYVVATIFICIFNGRSAKATREQVAESQRQFEDNKRLERMPYIDVAVVDMPPDRDIFDADVTLSFPKSISGEYVCASEWLEINNIGYGIATGISVEWKAPNGELESVNLPIRILEIGGKKEVGFRFMIAISCEQMLSEQCAVMLFHYKDLLGNSYKQTISFTFKFSSREDAELAEVKASTPEYENKEY